MSKIDIHSLKRPQREAVIPRTFTDETNPGKEITLWLRPLDPLEEEAVLSLSSLLISKYITGNWVDEDGQLHSEPLPLHAIDGEAIKLSERGLLLASRIQVMQTQDVYTAEELLAIAVCMPRAWQEILAVVGKLSSGTDGWAKKD